MKTCRFIFFFLVLTQYSWALSSELPSIETLNQLAEVARWDQGVTESVTINAPVEVVWKYVSDSTKARDWSVYFDHISPLPGIQDGQVGSLRRCFRNADESGLSWDEVTTIIQPLKMRQITTYNIKHLPWSLLTFGGYVFVRQHYRKISDQQTELTFQTVSPADANWIHRKVFEFSRRDTLRIFKQNLTNIKALIEGAPRVHPWE
jgi:hypothetical protein